MLKQSRDFVRVFSENWNRKLKSVRLLGAAVGVCMLVCAVLCMQAPSPMQKAMKIAAALVIIALGMYQLVDYYYMPILLRDAGTLINAVLNTVIGMLLMFSPEGITVSVFAYMFGFVLLIFGINKITFANKLHFFGILDYGWVIAGGVLNILAAAAFLILPLVSLVVLQTVLAGYLAIGGITLLVDVITMKNMKVEATQEQ